jgi:hypothetical protein
MHPGAGNLHMHTALRTRQALDSFPVERFRQPWLATFSWAHSMAWRVER